MAIVELTDFLVVISKVAVLSVAVVKVDTVLEDVNVKVAVLVAGVKVAPDLEGVVVIVAFFPKVVVDRKTSLARQFAWTASGEVRLMLGCRC